MNKTLNRKSLKLLFKNGNRPTENNFGTLIDSMVNVVDDGITKNTSDGLILAPEGKDSTRIISIYANLQDESADWSVDLDKDEKQGLSISDSQSRTRLFIDQNGNTGIDTEEPLTAFHVNGLLGANSRVGTYVIGSANANGSWQTIISNLQGCTAFEIVALVGKEKSGKYALAHVSALSTFGKSKIRGTQAHYGFFWNKIAFRFHGNQDKYSLQIKTRSDYGSGQQIKFHITKLWDSDIAALF